MKTPNFILDDAEMKSFLVRLAQADEGVTTADRKVRSYYLGDYSQPVWIDRYGVDERADSLLSWLQTLNELGFSKQAFGYADMEQDLKRMRNLDFTDDQPASKVAARLEYRLMRACMRYCYGQRYGFVNPNQVFNNLDAEKKDSLGNVTKYRQLYDISIESPGKHYFQKVINKVKSDSLAIYLREIQPRDNFYVQLKKMLETAATKDDRKRIMVNMERSRWRWLKPIDESSKRIVVNIPAYHLYAFGPDENLDMKVVCGNVRTKTPLLVSQIERFELNPQWVIPFSIVENELSRRAGDTVYFARNRYHIYARSTNKEMNVSQVTKEMLLTGRYRVAQEGGEGNSLGRIIFRFKNKFSVFLHDTSNPGAFERSSRAMSHGCIRVSQPFDLARFVLEEPDEWLLDRVRIAMGLPAETEAGLEYETAHPEVKDRNKVISHVAVSSRVPIYIIYYTLWPNEMGELQKWPDIYKYDEVIWNNLKPYM